MPVEPAADYVFDLGYYSFTWWSRLDAAGCRFVARLRKNSPAKVIAMRHVLKDGPIISAGMGARCTRAGQTSA